MFWISPGSANAFLEALAFAFQQFGLALPPRSEQLEVVYAVVTGRRSSDRIWQISLFTILFICVRDTCTCMCKMEAFSNPSFSSVVTYQPIESPNGRSIAGNCEIWNT